MAGLKCLNGEWVSWHSSLIARRLSARKLMTRRGTVYVLQGPRRLLPPDTDFTIRIIPEDFNEGFPETWQDYYHADVVPCDDATPPEHTISLDE